VEISSGFLKVGLQPQSRSISLTADTLPLRRDLPLARQLTLCNVGWVSLSEPRRKGVGLLSLWKWSCSFAGAAAHLLNEKN
jgi:hypothetical protein